MTLIRIILFLVLANCTYAGNPFSYVKRTLVCTACERTNDGKIKRSRSAVNRFIKKNPAPDYCKIKGEQCKVDHIVPLKCAASIAEQKTKLDVPENMQWQSKADSDAKDRWEDLLCPLETRQKVADYYKQKLPVHLKGK